jgi:molybdopterin molybdotransferase
MHLISVEEALSLVGASVKPLPPKVIPVARSFGTALANDIYAPVSLPLFSQSAVDGYALCADQINTGDIFQLIGEIKAGDAIQCAINKGEAVRIFTGAPIPEGTTHVAMQEHCTANASQVSVNKSLTALSNIRLAGGQVIKGAKVFEAGLIISAAAQGALASMGITEINVIPQPVVSVIVTGNELAHPGQTLRKGQIYESNGIALSAAAKSAGVSEVSVQRVPDNFEQTLQILHTVLSNSDLLLVAGGISVGDYDFVGKALRGLGVEEVFYKVRQKPGKPLFYGIYKGKPVFALPGNPAAALTCFFIYARPAIQALKGQGFKSVVSDTLNCLSEFEHNGSRSQFLKARLSADGVELLEGQASDNMLSFAHADALVYIPQSVLKVQKGAQVMVYLLPS